MKDELHFYGDDRHFNPKWLLLIPAIALIVAGSIFIYKHYEEPQEEETIEEPDGENPIETEINAPDSTFVEFYAWLDSTNAEKSSKVLTYKKKVLNTQLIIYLPVNCHPTLEVGYDVLNDTSNIIMCFAAADAGVKDRSIIGAYVLRGKPLSYGLSKKGFCAIINDTATVGMSENSPLFERAINKKGYFFRQRALVDSGKMMDNTLIDPYKYRALCQVDNHLFVAMSLKPIPILEFSQALRVLGVKSAITLQSMETAKGWYLKDDRIKFIGDWESRKYPKTTNFICWKVNGK